VNEPIEQLRGRYAALGQDHVFRFWDRLDGAGRARLAAQARRIDLGALREHSRRALELQAPGVRRLSPPEVEQLPERGGDAARRAEGRRRGEALLRAGEVGIVVVAGGQGTRLGFEAPKGTFPIGPITGRSLYELHAQKVRAARRRYGAPIPWYVMTSPATDAETRAFFARHRWFGLPEADVGFFCQGTIPALDFAGRLLLEAPDRIAESPNGHGGCFTALAESGVLDDLHRRGIRVLSYFQVDNPLVRVADPIFLGLHALARAEMSCKVIRKVDPMERVGVFAQLDGHVGVVEYTEIDDDHRRAPAPDGGLLFWAGSPAIHALDVNFAERVAKEAECLLPFHASAKKIPFLDEDGRLVQPEQPNGHKLERFLFDALPAAARVALVEVDRALEYAPVKNAEGADSPASARAALGALCRGWLEAAGLVVPADAAIELDHAEIDCVEDAVERGLASLADPAIRIAEGGA
jgi:UDP-N-acetylglucosamine/UDP-N-acetylgalactosamine diphosphorylase